MQEFGIRVHSAASAPAVYALLTVGASWPKWSPIGSFELETAEGSSAPEGPQIVGDVRVFRTGRHVSRERVVELGRTSASVTNWWRAARCATTGPTWT